MLQKDPNSYNGCKTTRFIEDEMRSRIHRQRRGQTQATVFDRRPEEHAAKVLPEREKGQLPRGQWCSQRKLVVRKWFEVKRSLG